MSNTPVTSNTSPVVQVPVHIISRFDVSGPRYTSYPTADRFVEAFTAEDYERALRERTTLPASHSRSLSLYVHIPFCQSLCYYCACNKIITKHHHKSVEYLEYLFKEIELTAKVLNTTQTVTQLHFGGGSPTFLDDTQLEMLMNKLRSHFHFAPSGEFAIEVDPRTIDSARLAALFRMGFNRLSFGVQDFNTQVQKAVHREQSTQAVFELMKQARALGFRSINVDLIYGLPEQTIQTLEETLNTVVELKPDRLALYAYAHLPERFKPQRRIDSHKIPSGSEKIAMRQCSLELLGKAGYDYVGMDHFALPQDELSIAKHQGRLHRNFQGYSTQPDCDCLGLGVSAIGRIGATYSQNAKDLDTYYAYLEQNQFPIERGLHLSKDDLIRRSCIMSIMCQGVLNFEPLDSAFLIDSKSYFKQEFENLKELVAQGLVKTTTTGLEVTDTGWYVVRAVAMLFDRYLQDNQNRNRFSKIL